jgi:hypothetical protein
MTHTNQHTQSGAPREGRSRTRSVSVRTALGSAGAVATVAGAAVLGVLTLAADDQNEATRYPLAAEQDSSHTTQSAVQDHAGPSGGRAPAGVREHERFAACVEAETRSLTMASSTDDGLPNPWQVGNLAAKCHLVGSGAPSTSAIGSVTEPTTSTSPPTGTTPTCSFWSIPTLEAAPVPQSNMTEGMPYVAACIDADEETTFVFLYGHASHTPAPHR